MHVALSFLNKNGTIRVVKLKLTTEKEGTRYVDFVCGVSAMGLHSKNADKHHKLRRPNIPANNNLPCQACQEWGAYPLLSFLWQ